MSNDDPQQPRDADPEGEARLRRRPIRRQRESELHEEAARETAAQRTRPRSDPEYTRPSLAAEMVSEPDAEQTDPEAMRRAERAVTGMFLLSVLGTVVFCVAFATMSLHTPSYGQAFNLVIGAGMTLSMFGLGAGMVMWAKKLMPHEEAVQEREPMHSPEEDQLLSEELFLKGADELGLARRRVLRRTALLALGLFPVPFVFALRDMGPLPGNKLEHSGWRKGIRLVSLDTKEPIKIGDLPVGGAVKVMPEGFVSVNEFPIAPSYLIRLPPGVNEPKKGRENWAVEDHVVYDIICTHAGCPVALYEQQTHHLLCPCHQSTFDVPRACKVIFGPAGHPLPQLPIYLDNEGYFRAQSDFHEPPGPSYFWRGSNPKENA